ncbi:TonB-dependent receptor [Seongchinamella sediminis]|uniref:TonB-dependent receptor n=1 Tax=Seongchinamella sediminis TaxID=2283635 RepID=A0A3L7E238_9GAMM|nr:TonB-dependent receptor [Seongchinamella sediminis]RLQ22393.1 TonB-dependent receptor [Seongchinamella sediminis]
MIKHRFTKNPGVVLTLAVSSASLLMSASTQAQLEEVVVTAQKRSESLQDVPITLTAFAGDSLQDFGITDTQALQIVTPGLVVNNTSTSAQIYLRGVGTRFAFSGLDPSVATYIDDRYVGRSQASSFEFSDVERIEVLKGPQGTLYGRNATGGAVRVVTLGVYDELEGNVTATAGNYNAWGLSGTINIPVSDTFGMRLSGLAKQRDGFADNLSPLGSPEYDDQDYQAYRGKFRWLATDALTAQLTLEYNKRDDQEGNDVVDLSPPGWNRAIAIGEATGREVLAGRDVDEVATVIDQNLENEDWAATLRLDYAFDSMDFVSISSYWDWDAIASADTDGTTGRDADAPYIPYATKSISQEFQLLSNNDSDLEWIVGAFYYNEDNDPFQINLDLSDLLPPASPLYPVRDNIAQGNQSSETTAYAVFGQATYHFDEAWSLTLGGRYSIEEKEVEVMQPLDGEFSLAPWPYKDDEDWSEFTPKATLEYAFDAGMVYLTYARGFKSGGFNFVTSAPDPITGEPQEPLEPEILDMLEFGWKTELLDSMLRLNGALFYYDYADLQVTRAVTNPDTGAVINVTQNAANAEIIGLDLDATWLVSDALTLTLGLNLLDSEYEDYDASANVFARAIGVDAPGMVLRPFDADGESLLRAPDWSAFVSARYEFNIGDARMPLVVSYSYKDAYDYDFIGHPTSAPLEQEAYGLLSARLSYVTPGEDWRISIWGNNLTDEDEYFEDIVANAAGIRASHGAPRTYGVDVRFNF